MELLLALVAVVAPAAAGVLIVRRQRLVGLLLVAHGTSAAVVLPSWFSPGSRADLVADQLLAGAWPFLFVWVALIGYVVPDGRPSSPFWERWVRFGLVGVGLFVVGAAGSDPTGFRETHGGAAPPVTWLPAGVSTVLSLVGLLLVVLLLFGSVVSVAQRLRRARGEARKQLLWLVLGVVPVPVTLAVGWVSHFLLDSDGGPIFTALLTLTALALPTCLGIAIARHRLFDIELVLSRTLTFVVLVAGTAVVYTGLLVGADRFFGESEAGGVVAIAVVAVVLTPAHGWVRRKIERWVYGYRSEPHLAMRMLADRAEAAEPAGLVEAVTAAVAEALQAERVWIGEPGSGEPLVYRDERLGDLAVQMPAGAALTPAQEGLLRDLARYAATIVRAERLNVKLRESRRSIVEGREEERRRLRRDLHDGVGPSLASVLLLLGAAQARPGSDAKDALLAEASDEVKEAIGEVRRVVEDLRPPAIDQIGLVDALRQRAAVLSSSVDFDVRTGESLPDLPAAVEVAAYRIASEAMTNVARHSGAGRCRVELTVNGHLELSVLDDGVGVGAMVTRGVGWTSMQERAAELGGTCSVGGSPAGGVLVHAVLPLVAHTLVEESS